MAGGGNPLPFGWNGKLPKGDFFHPQGVSSCDLGQVLDAVFCPTKPMDFGEFPIELGYLRQIEIMKGK
jgi:hypothetical protein